MSNFLESGLLNFLFRSNSNSFAAPLNVSIALCSGIPDDASRGVTLPELPNTGSYARLNLGAPSNATWTEITQAHGAFSSGNIDNVAQFSFTQATANWGWVSGVAVVNSGVYGAGEVLLWGKLVTPREVLNGDTFVFSAGEFDIFFG